MTRRIVVCAVLAAVLLTGIWYGVLWSPQSSKLKQARAGTAQAQQQAELLQRQVAALRVELKDLPSRQAHLAQLVAALPSAAQLDSLLDQLRSAESGSGVQILSLTAAPPSSSTPGQVTSSSSSSLSSPASAAANTIQSIGLAMQATGSYPQVVDFVNRLKTVPRLLVVDSLTLSSELATGAESAAISARAFTASVGGA